MSDIKVSSERGGPKGPRGHAGPEGPRGPRGHAGQTGQPGPTGTAGSTGPTGTAGSTGPTGAAGSTGSVTGPPARTLFVALSWPAGVDPTVYFTTIAAALVQAATLSPTAASPVSIIIYPGTYSDPLTLVSNVSLTSTGRRTCIITGPITWTAGAGVNAPQAADREEVDMVLIAVLAPVSIDTTAKTGGSLSTLDARDSAFRDGVTFTGRDDTTDYFQVWNAVTLGAVMSFDSVNMNIFSSSTDALTCTGNCAVDVRATEVFGAVSISGTSIGAIEASQLNGPVAINAGVTIDFTGSRFQPGAVLTVAAGGSADIRMAEYDSNANLAGAGTINRSIWRTTFGPTAVGPNTVPIAPPLSDGAYNACLTQTGGPIGFPPIVTAKTGSGFTLTDSVAGRTFDVSIVKE